MSDLDDRFVYGDGLDCPNCEDRGLYGVTKEEDDPTVLILSCHRCGHKQLAEVELHARGER